MAYLLVAVGLFGALGITGKAQERYHDRRDSETKPRARTKRDGEHEYRHSARSSRRYSDGAGKDHVTRPRSVSRHSARRRLEYEIQPRRNRSRTSHIRYADEQAMVPYDHGL